jgi:hypothetical protein
MIWAIRLAHLSPQPLRGACKYFSPATKAFLRASAQVPEILI